MGAILILTLCALAGISVSYLIHVFGAAFGWLLLAGLSGFIVVFFATPEESQ